MKILHIAPIGHHAEGIGTVLQELVPIQISLGMDVRIITPLENHTYKELPITTVINKQAFIRYIGNWTPDIVIFHSVYCLQYALFYRILEACNIPYLIQLHGALSEENFRKNNIKKRIALYLWIRRFISHAKSIIYLNLAEYKKSVVPRINDQHLILPNGCTLQENVDLYKDVGEFVKLIFIGRIAYTHKGLDVLIDALKILDEKNVGSYQVCFYGNEDDIDVARLKVDIKSLPNVLYGGGVYGDIKNKVLTNADIFILTSRYEGMPMGVLEAWTYGIPCILTEGTNMVKEQSDTDCYWFTDLDSNSIAETIIRAISQYRENPYRYRKGSIVESQKYEWKNIARASVNMYAAFTDK